MPRSRHGRRARKLPRVVGLIVVLVACVLINQGWRTTGRAPTPPSGVVAPAHQNAPVEPPVPLLQTAPPVRGRTVSVASFGATGNDATDDTVAVQTALNSLKSGDRLVFPPGTYHHNDVLTARVADVQIVGPGAILTADREALSAFVIDADRVFVGDLTFTASPTRRWTANEQMKVRIAGHVGVTLWHVQVRGSAAAGIYVDDGAASFRIEGATVSDTQADGIHMTGGAHDGLVLSPTVIRSGDDGVAIVSYDGGANALCTKIRVISPRVLTTAWGRGISVVGGSDISYSNLMVQNSNAAAVYIGVEGTPYNTQSVERVTIDGGTVTGANYNATIDHGAVMIFAGRPGSRIDDVSVDNLTIENTRPTAQGDISVVSSGVPPTGLTFRGITMRGGPVSRFGGNVPQSSYDVED